MKQNVPKEVLTFDPRQLVGKFLNPLSPRAQEVLKNRFGLEAKKGLTLEAIGRTYGITRERVRQIEDCALRTIKESPILAEATSALNELKAVVGYYGGVVHEREFLKFLSPDPLVQNNVHLLLVLGDAFTRLREDEFFHHRWTIDSDFAEAVHHSLRRLCQQLNIDNLLSEDEIVAAFLTHCHEAVRGSHPKERVKNWIGLCKEIGRNPIGEWGLAKSPNIRMRGIRDRAYLVMRRVGKPMHFSEVAKLIKERFGREANVATTHNELIKDSRFVLVGRGIYALAERGYPRGVVRDVIRQVLTKRGALTKEEVLEEVLKRRVVKPGTVLLNLRNRRDFRRTNDNKYVPRRR